MNTYLAGSGVRVEFATLSGQGGREYNEDACGYWTSDDGACFIVCDGAGGHGGGDVASETAVRTLLSAYSSVPELSQQNIERIITQTDVAIRYGQQLAGEVPVGLDHGVHVGRVEHGQAGGQVLPDHELHGAGSPRPPGHPGEVWQYAVGAPKWFVPVCHGREASTSAAICQALP